MSKCLRQLVISILNYMFSCSTMPYHISATFNEKPGFYRTNLGGLSYLKSRLVVSKPLLLLFTRPLPRDGGMAEDHGAPEAGQLPRVWTRGRTETENCRRVSGATSP